MGGIKKWKLTCRSVRYLSYISFVGGEMVDDVFEAKEPWLGT